MATIVDKYIDSSSFETASAVFDDVHLTIKSVDGVYQHNNQYRIQLNGLLGPLFNCEICGIPCGENITPPGGGPGLYQLEFSAGGTQADVGAIVIYFNPQTIPDGIRVLYDGVYYNRLSVPATPAYVAPSPYPQPADPGGNRQSTSGVADAFTIIGSPTYATSSNCPNIFNAPTTDPITDFYDGYSNGSWDVGSHSPQSTTINTGDLVYGGRNVFSTLVVPKPNASPAIVTIQVLGPCDSTGWNIKVNCAEPLPSFSAQAIGSSTSCGTTTVTLYFARFQGDTTSSYPQSNAPVFLDANGASRVADQNYLMDNNQVITVTNGVVSNTQSCT